MIFLECRLIRYGQESLQIQDGCIRLLVRLQVGVNKARL